MFVFSFAEEGQMINVKHSVLRAGRFGQRMLMLEFTALNSHQWKMTDKTWVKLI